MFQDFGAAVPNRQAGVQGSLWGWGERKDGGGQEPGGRAETEGDRNARVRSWLPRAAVFGNGGPDNGIQEAEILQEPATVLYRFVEKPSL